MRVSGHDFGDRIGLLSGGKNEILGRYERGRKIRCLQK